MSPSNRPHYRGTGGSGTTTLETYSTPGTYTFSVPAGVTSVTFELWGAGGNGAGGGPCNVVTFCTGGASGGYGVTTISVVAGHNYDVSLPAPTLSGQTAAASIVTDADTGTQILEVDGGYSGACNKCGDGNGGGGFVNCFAGTCSSKLSGLGVPTSCSDNDGANGVGANGANLGGSGVSGAATGGSGSSPGGGGGGAGCTGGIGGTGGNPQLIITGS